MRLSSLAVLFWLNENAGAVDTRVPEDVCPQRFIKGAYDELREHKLIVDDERMAGAVTFTVLPSAAERVDELAGMYRPEAIKRSVLKEIQLNPDSGSTEDYLDGINILGGPVTPSELDSAVKALREDGLIDGTSSYGYGSNLNRPVLTSAGEGCLQSSDVAIAHDGTAGSRQGNTTHHNINVQGSTIGAVSSGDRNAVTVHQQIVPAIDLPALFAELKSAFQQHDMSEKDRGRYLGQIELIEDEFEDDQDKERATKGVRRLLSKVPGELLQNLRSVVPAAATIISSL